MASSRSGVSQRSRFYGSFFKAAWPSGKVGVCKTFYAGSNPAAASEVFSCPGKQFRMMIVGRSYFCCRVVLNLTIVINHFELNLLNTEAFDNGQVDYLKQRYMCSLATTPLAEGRILKDPGKLSQLIRAKLTEIGLRHNADLESVAVAWLIKLGAFLLIGTADEKRIGNLVAAFDFTPDRQKWYELFVFSGKGSIE